MEEKKDNLSNERLNITSILENANHNSNNVEAEATARQLERLFYMDELILWYTTYPSIGSRHRLINNDALVITDENNVGTLFGRENLIERHSIGEAIPENKQQIVFFEPLTPELLRSDHFKNAEDYLRYGFYQHQFLRKILILVDEKFGPFITRFSSYKREKIAITDVDERRAYLLIKDLISFLETNIIENHYGLIPDLYSYCPDSSLMSCRDKLILLMMEETKDGSRYAYMFSRKTSENFALVLMEILQGKLEKQHEIAKLRLGIGKTNAKKDFILPIDAPERLKELSKHYSLDSLRIQNRNTKYTKGQIVFLFKILEVNNFTLDIISKEQLALGISLLTGISAKKIYDLYPKGKDPIDFAELLDKKTPEAIRSDLTAICNAVKSAFHEAGKKHL